MTRCKFSGLAVLAVAILCFGFPASADKLNTETSSSARAFGMGNAVINSERGPYAVFYNPANIAAKDTGTHFQVLNVQIDVNDPTLALLASGKVSNPVSPAGNLPTLTRNPNEYYGGRYSVYPNITMRNFSVGVLYEYNQGAVFRPDDNTLRIKARDRFGPVAALSYRLFKGVLRFGISTQYMSVGNADTSNSDPGATINQPIHVAPDGSTSVNTADYIQSRAGIVNTAGVTLTLPFRYLPSFSLVARNIPGTNFSLPSLVKFGHGTTVPREPMTFDMAASMTFYAGRRIELKPEFDYKDTVNKLQAGRFRHAFMGAELIFFDFMHFRAGIMHGYYTAGFGFSTRQASLDLATYADELDDRLRGASDRRYVLQYTWGLFR